MPGLESVSRSRSSSCISSAEYACGERGKRRLVGMGGGGVGVGGQSTTITQQPQQQQSLHFELQGQVQQTPAMEEFLEHIFAMPWDYNAGAGAMAMERAGADFAMVGVGVNNNGDNNNVDSGGSSMSTAAQKRFAMSLTPPGLLNNGTLVGGNQASALVSSQALVNQVLEEKKESGVESVHCSADDALITTHLHQQQQQLQGEETQSLKILCLCLLFLRRSVSFVRQDAGELATERRESRFAADVQVFLEGWSCLIYLGCKKDSRVEIEWLCAEPQSLRALFLM